MSKNYIYIIVIIGIFISGLLIGSGSVKGELDRITGNLQSAESRVNYLEGSLSRSNNTVKQIKDKYAEAQRLNKEQAVFIDKITDRIDSSGESIIRLESGTNRGSEIIKNLLDKIQD